MYEPIPSDEIKSYKYVARELIAAANKKIRIDLDSDTFTTHVVAINQSGNNIIFNLNDLSDDIPKLMDIAKKISDEIHAVGIMVVWKSSRVEVPNTDRNYASVVRGLMDTSSIPPEFKHENILAYCEMVGNIREIYIIPLDDNGKVDEELVKSVNSQIDVRSFEYWPLISQNERVN